MSVDPLADDPDNIGWSPYTYVWNNPVRFIDPTGMKGDTVPDGRYIWELNHDELALFNSYPGEPEWESQERFDQMREKWGTTEFDLTLSERLYLFSGFGMLLMPSAKLPTRAVPVVSNASKTLNSVDEYINILKPIDDLDNITLYRGMTGSESSGKVLFLTDDVSVAVTYIKNNLSVQKFNLSRLGLSKLRFSGQLENLSGIHGPTGKVSQEYKFIGENLKKAVLTQGTY